MFVQIGNKFINMDNVTYIEDQGDGARYVMHFADAEHQSMTFNAGVINDSSYSDLRRFLKSQSAAAQEVQV